jgi:hypothetical protein
MQSHVKEDINSSVPVVSGEWSSENPEVVGWKRRKSTSVVDGERKKSGRHHQKLSEASSMWPRHYAALLMYAQERGHCNVPSREEYECYLKDENGELYHYKGRLGAWVRYQKQRKNGTSSGGYRLSRDRETLLQQLVDKGITLLHFPFAMFRRTG